MTVQAWVGRVYGVLGVVEEPLDLTAESDEVTEVLRHDRQIELSGGQGRVDRPAVGDGHANLAPGGRHRHVAGYHPAGYVGEVDRDHALVLEMHPCGHPPGWHVDHDVNAAGLRGRDVAGLHCPDPQRDGAVPAGGRETVLVPEEHPQVSAVVVRRHDESAVHVRMAARF
jgi:hypothetical protein